MIKTNDKKDCCGCSACVQRCPKQCISLYEDEEGFMYPRVDKTVCIDCGLCEKVCPVLNQSEGHEPIAVYAAKNPNEEIRMQSSSGGIFTMLAERIIDEGGVVFGACWDKDWNVVHDYAESKEDIAKFRGSKYVQSNIGETFKQTETFLIEGRKVLFSGTPCQIAGLKHFLLKDYDNLLTIEIICHSVPSPGVWKKYLTEELNSNGLTIGDIQQINFRDKSTGWETYSFLLHTKADKDIIEFHGENPFVKGFLFDLYTRPSCQQCPAKSRHSNADIILGDFWKIQSMISDIYDDKGVSAIIINSPKAESTIKSLNINLYPTSWYDLSIRNKALVRSVNSSCKRTSFFKNTKVSFKQKISIYCKPHPKARILRQLILFATKLLTLK